MNTSGINSCCAAPAFFACVSMQKSLETFCRVAVWNPARQISFCRRGRPSVSLGFFVWEGAECGSKSFHNTAVVGDDSRPGILRGAETQREGPPHGCPSLCVLLACSVTVPRPSSAAGPGKRCPGSHRPPGPSPATGGGPGSARPSRSPSCCPSGRRRWPGLPPPGG